ncbi:MAG: Mu transposase C-terminal domain-containing protein, partial [Tepidisphaeraceae bacterium]
ANLRTKRVIDERRLMLETCRRELLKVGRNGVTWRGLTYQHPELDNRTGETVALLIDDANVNRAIVLHASGSRKGAAICEATLAGRLDVRASEEDVRDAMAEVRRDIRRVKDAGPAKIRLADDPLERLHRIAVKKAEKAPRPSPDAIKPVQPTSGPSTLRIAQEGSQDESPEFRSFGYYGSFADEDDAKAVNE